LIDIKNTSEIISAKQVIENVIQTFPFKNGIEQSAVKYYCLNNFMFNASETLFTQLLNNLLRNSFKAMAVKEMSDQSKKIHISSYVSKQAYGKLFGFITVADNGTGIQSDDLKKILEPFFSTNDAIGHGLGLFFCQKVVAACKGQLSIKSTFGHSTTITIELPIHSLAAQTDDYV
jgi:two-component system CAI-1 autoinducer sensor kinase/phosphatase CqsS